ncbi:unnamed protein product [Orchesella dallaii]|uniref:Uncharacterized protein n=1 Tax=Orchesella dallaii TaxID=48710 RepID=A0ABP1RUY7_9HEXA
MEQIRLNPTPVNPVSVTDSDRSGWNLMVNLDMLEWISQVGTLNYDNLFKIALEGKLGKSSRTMLPIEFNLGECSLLRSGVFMEINQTRKCSFDLQPLIGNHLNSNLVLPSEFFSPRNPYRKSR